MEYTQQLEWINSLTEKQLTEFLNLAFNARKQSSDYEESRFFLGHAFRFKEEDTKEAYNISIVCSYDPAEYEHAWDDEAPLCQSGYCLHCHVETISYAKQGLCTICGNPVYGT
jgi:hypothetical protein